MKTRATLSWLISYAVLPLMTSYAVAGTTTAEAVSKVPLATIGKNKIKLEVACTPYEIQRGLMFRTSMPEDAGMVFIFHPEREVAFWMKNTLIPLDMLFIKDGKILKICQNVPPCKKDPCPNYPEEGPILVTEVVELNGGYTQRHGIKEGDKITFEFLAPPTSQQPPASSQPQQTQQSPPSPPPHQPK